jgi:hypothetical protein
MRWDRDTAGRKCLTECWVCCGQNRAVLDGPKVERTQLKGCEPSPFAGGLAELELGIEYAAEVDDAKQHCDEQRRHKGHLDRDSATLETARVSMTRRLRQLLGNQHSTSHFN